MKRVVLFFSLLAGLVFVGIVQASDSPAPPPPTTTAETPTTIAAGVTIAGVDVGGLATDAAATAVQSSFDRALDLRVGATRVLVTPDLLGAKASVDKAVEKASTALPDTQLPLGVTVDQSVTASFVATLAKRFDRAAVDAKLFLRSGRPSITKERKGTKLDQKRSVRVIVTALTTNDRDPVPLVTRRLAPKSTRKNWGPVIVIHRGENRLFLYHGMRFWRVFTVATGQTAYPTPLGRFSIVVKWRNPWWYPPASPWAKGLKPVPPGPDNPLGTRWMGLSVSGVGIHGTPSDGSIGYSVSHGCIRMHIPEAEWLFDHVDVGTTVFIVPG